MYPSRFLTVTFDLKETTKNNLRSPEMFMYAYISGFTRKGLPCFANTAYFARILNMCENSVRACFKSLTRKKMIYSVKVNRKIHRYAILDEQADTPPGPAEATESIYQPSEIKRELKNCGQKLKNCGIYNIYNINTYTPLPPKKTPEEKKRERNFLERNKNFEIAWSSYPRKDAKEAAREVWHKLGRKDLLPGMESVLKAINTQRKQESWNRDNGRYIPYFVTWLKNMRFADPEPVQEISSELAQIREAYKKTEERISRENPKTMRLRQQFDEFCRNRDVNYPPQMSGMAFGLWANLYQRKLVTDATFLSGDLLSGLKKIARGYS